MDVTYRVATIEDAEASAECHMACWREAYGPLVDPALLEARLDRERWVESTREILAHGGPRWLALHGGQVVGLATAGPTRDENSPAPYELYAIYVREAWQGTGVAQELFDRAVPAGVGCSLWVLEANPRAQAFYRRQGFEADGTREFYGGLGAWEIRMVRPAAD